MKFTVKNHKYKSNVKTFIIEDLDVRVYYKIDSFNNLKMLNFHFGPDDYIDNFMCNDTLLFMMFEKYTRNIENPMSMNKDVIQDKLGWIRETIEIYIDLLNN